MWRRPRSRLLFCSQSRCCSSVRLALLSSPPTVACRPPSPCRCSLSPAPTPALTLPVRPAAPLSVFPAPHMASAQSSGSSGGPAVPTVQRGIVKMVRAGPWTRTPLLPWSGSQALTSLPSVSLHGLSSRFLCPLLSTYSRNLHQAEPERTSLDFCLPGKPVHDSVTVIFVVAAFRAPGCLAEAGLLPMINGNSSRIVTPIPLFLSFLTYVDHFAVFLDPDIFSWNPRSACLSRSFSFH